VVKIDTRSRRALLEHAEDRVIRLHFAASVIADVDPKRSAEWRREADELAADIKTCRERMRTRAGEGNNYG